MSTTETTQKTLTDAPTAEPTTTYDGLAEIVAQTTPLGDRFPDFDQFNAVCKATKNTIERLSATEEI